MRNLEEEVKAISFSSFLFLTHSSLEELLSLATFTVVKSSFLKGRKVAACLIQFQHFGENLTLVYREMKLLLPGGGGGAG